MPDGWYGRYEESEDDRSTEIQDEVQEDETLKSKKFIDGLLAFFGWIALIVIILLHKGCFR